MQEPLWVPTEQRARQTRLTDFIERLRRETGLPLVDYAALQRLSITDVERFWRSFVDWADIRAERWGEVVLQRGAELSSARWFPEARLNFTDNLLRRDGDDEAIVFRAEAATTRRAISWSQLRRQVAQLSRALAAAGVGPGDRVAGYMPNIPEAVVALLAAASLGAVWSSSSPDFGVQGVLDRFGQIEPKVLFTADGYRYKGRRHGSLERVRQLRDRLPSVTRVVVTPYVDERARPEGIQGSVLWGDFVAGHDDGALDLQPFPFDHPLVVMYSSGTTGVPKAIVHGAGGTLLQHVKEHRLHCDIRAGDRVFYFTTCGWMMWNWLASALASGATLLLYDGSPTHPTPDVLWDYAASERMTLFGTAAKYLHGLRNAGFEPGRGRDLSALRTVTSTGSPLAPEGFDYVYERIKGDVQLASIAGGTDILGCFVCGNPNGPVWRGEIQARALGMAVEVFDDAGEPVRERPGELVCTAPFPSMPVGFWNDPDGRRYHAAYFERFPGVWHHGDWAEITAHDGVIIHGRSDAVLNPSGVRIGTAEIYHAVEKLREVEESIAVGQRWGGDVRVVLFVVLAGGRTLDDELRQVIRQHLRQSCSPHHVPARIVQVQEIPRTRSGKITELAVSDVIHGRPVANRDALANPDALEHFAGLVELER